MNLRGVAWFHSAGGRLFEAGVAGLEVGLLGADELPPGEETTTEDGAGQGKFAGDATQKEARHAFHF